MGFNRTDNIVLHFALVFAARQKVKYILKINKLNKYIIPFKPNTATEVWCALP